MLLRAALTSFRRGSTLDAAPVSTSVTADRSHLAAYNAVCGFRLTDELPVTYPHVLGFGLQMRLMTGPGFPFPLPGLVHVANRITQTRPLRADEPLEISVSAAGLREHPSGMQVDVVTSVNDVWHDVSTYLKRTKDGSAPGERPERPASAAVWHVPGDIGRRYARVSGDRNPIHLHPLTAKVFGFRRAIAHGMWTKARCLASLEGRLPEAFTVEVGFKAPLLLPGKAFFAFSDGEFSVWGRERPHLLGTWTA
ncbi:hypothetical protein Lesp02_53560 [Lentzea sp. NBRC 105346]|uniref:MaoC family dehydratase n=1 Tax=Lentzea sp. NBRC 105346 TaxID=3032205 RepID=UPI0024A2A53E|nr:MaoC/PaaZ C-terminal domain-containing protein [Lentzea sp. NBRC 105346]GLZ33168.1 hypothetical protein Lesp02_53560 [Lentzea sp. NBRC 105346]